MKRAWFALLLASACGGATAQTTMSNPPGATLRVTLGPSEETPTAVRMEVSNPHPAPIEFCRAHTPFEGLRNDLFEVRGPAGTDVPYRGEMAKRAPPGPEDCFAVGPGRHHQAEVDLAEGYALQAGTTYRVQYRASTISRLPASDVLELQVE